MARPVHKHSDWRPSDCVPNRHGQHLSTHSEPVPAVDGAVVPVRLHLCWRQSPAWASKKSRIRAVASIPLVVPGPPAGEPGHSCVPPMTL